MQVVVFDIKKNHAIVAWYDEETGEKAYKPVVRLSRNTTKEWYHIRVNGEEIVCTGGHPFYVLNAEEDRKIVRYEGVKSDKNGRWIEAKELKKDDKLLLSDGSYGIINSVAVETLESPETTYNFEVEDFHTYFVSDSNVLVHNSCKYFEATRTENGVRKGRQITTKEALNRIRNGRDVMTSSKSSAKSLTKNAFGNSKSYSEIHESLINPMAHFHDANHHSYHVFFGNNFI